MDKITISDINRDNYYDIKDVLSASTIKSFETCEAAALASYMGDYVRPSTTALLVGGYIDAALDSDAELDKFKSAHPEIINSRTGQLKADFVRAADVVARCKDDPLFRALTIDSPQEGHQYIVLGSIGVTEFGEPIPCKGNILRGRRRGDVSIIVRLCCVLGVSPERAESILHAAGYDISIDWSKDNPEYRAAIASSSLDECNAHLEAAGTYISGRYRR